MAHLSYPNTQVCTLKAKLKAYNNMWVFGQPKQLYA